MNADSRPTDADTRKPDSYEIAAWIITAISLLLVLKLHLLPALISGFLIYELVHVIAGRLRTVKLSGRRSRIVVVALLSLILVIVLTVVVWGIVLFVHSEQGNLPALLNKMAEIIGAYWDKFPDTLKQYLPIDTDEIRKEMMLWLKEHSAEIGAVGKEAGSITVHLLIGVVLGVILSLREAASNRAYGPFALALAARAGMFGNAFRSVVFAQVRIAALNTLFAAIYLAVALPIAGVHLPLVKTMIIITFITGLLPVVGNIISNTIIVIVSLHESFSVAIASLIYLVVIHKLEYFLNARIVGSRISSHAWELLIAMLVMEAAFGIPGVIAAPIYYAYLKSELTERGLV